MALIFEQEVEEALTELPMAKIMSQRKNRPLLCVSYFEPVAEQRNQKQDLSRFYNLYYYKKADLDQIVADNLRTHRQNTDTINQLIEKEVEDFVTWVHAKEPYRFGNIIGKSREMQRILELVARIAQTDISVIIDGESGTGKELIARAIHEHSRRAQNPFVVVNCGAIPEGLLESELFGHVRGAFTGATVNRKGLFEVANHGTIFLDEIGETSLTMQVKLLRFLQEGEIKPVGSTQTLHVDVRLLAATNRNLEKMVEEGTFRQDLYYRLNVIRLTIPPLSERPEDILPIAEFFIKKYAARIHKTVLGLDESARQVLTGYTWPGNVRELENAIERAVALASGPYLTREDFPAAMGNGHVAAVPQDGVKALSLK
ncbi:MAG: AAA family ATPase, partial [Calditrichaeota bacterium]